MYDPEFNSTFSKGNLEERWWDGGEPIWVTNQKNGGKTASIFYPGDRVNISGKAATYNLPYDESLSFNNRVDHVITQIVSGNVNLGLLYFHEPDRSGHDHGPDSPEVIDAIKLCDRTLGYLIDQLLEHDLMDRANVIVTSDHGMTDVSASRTVFLNDYIDPSLNFYTENDPVFGIWPHDEADTVAIYQTLRGSHPNLTVYLKEDIPDELHYRNNRRVGPILAFTDLGWNLWTNQSEPDDWAEYKGNHGFLSTYRPMSAMFIARGRGFRKGYVSQETFETVEIYNLMCHLLNISPAPNNGTLSNVEWMLASSVATTQAQTTAFLSVLSASATILASIGIGTM